MNHPIFLLGAGFNRDARQYAGPIPMEDEHKPYLNYPLVMDLAQECFGRDLGESESIEELFAAHVKARNFAPLQRLCDVLMKADWYIARRLTESYAASNPYTSFLDRFRGCHFLTFNYDSLPEILLFKRRAWYPQDGYGVPVGVMVEHSADSDLTSRRSLSNVLHLHGSLCVNTIAFQESDKPGNDIIWIEPKEIPDYIFDAYSIAPLFFPYRAPPRTPVGYEPIEERLIAPIPDKAEGLKREFIAAVHSCAEGLLGLSSTLIVIGFSFNELDKQSYDHLLRSFASDAQRRVVLVSPDAGTLKDRLSRSYSKIQWDSVEASFAEWANAGFPGI